MEFIDPNIFTISLEYSVVIYLKTLRQEEGQSIVSN